MYGWHSKIVWSDNLPINFLVCSVGSSWGCSGPLMCNFFPLPDFMFRGFILFHLNMVWYGHSPLACVGGCWFIFIEREIYVLWCLYIKAIYGLLCKTSWYCNMLLLKYKRLAPQHCSSRATRCPCFPRVDGWTGCYASIDTGHPLNTEQHTVTNLWPGDHSAMVTQLKWGILDMGKNSGVGQSHFHISGAIKVSPEAIGKLEWVLFS